MSWKGRRDYGRMLEHIASALSAGLGRRVTRVDAVEALAELLKRIRSELKQVEPTEKLAALQNDLNRVVNTIQFDNRWTNRNGLNPGTGLSGGE